MTDAGAEALDDAWLNDSTDYQLNFVHGLRNPSGLHLQYHLEGDHVVTAWTPDHNHAGFPGFVHGGLIAAVLDDVMGRCSVLQRRWVVTGRMETRFRAGAPIGAHLRVEGWMTRLTRRGMLAESALRSENGVVLAQASGTYLSIPRTLIDRMVNSWPGFAEFAAGDA
ncbi:MAG: PaaI family thioesterase [Candidatus Dormibacteraeota bacterium]|uniref:Acyl-coenzyme A thioesterase THEM4 n=1 Tax=Candidatus Amunia macphersoniae TaxID=3127014 RepID=A0A934NFQ0_9BACT|nr:PaaI family thioesterase [Candidatus Dormibacteraeota bacterium]